MSSKKETTPIKYKTLKGISSIIGGIFHGFSTGSIFPLANFLYYLISYLHHQEGNEWIQIKHSYFAFPLMMFFFLTSGMIGGFLDNQIGIIRTIIISEGVLLIATSFLYVNMNLIAVYFIFILLGIGLGISGMVTGKNSCMYFPDRRGLVNSIAGSCVTLWSAFLNLIGETIINKNKISADKDTSIYPLDIAKNVKLYFILQMVCYGIFGLLAIVFIVPYEGGYEEPNMMKKASETNKDEIDEKLEQLNTNSIIPQGRISSFADSENLESESLIKVQEQDYPLPENNIVEANEESKDNVNNYTMSAVKQAFHSWRVWRLSLVNLFTPFIVGNIMSTYRKVASMKEVGEIPIEIVGTGGFVISCIFLPIWGILVDKLPFKLLFLVINALSVGLGFLYYFTLNNPITFIVTTLSINMINAGNISIMGPHIMKVFGMKYSIEITVLVSFTSGISSLLSSTFTFLIDTFLNGSLLAYKIVYFVSSGLGIISLILGLFEDDTPFVYE